MAVSRAMSFVVGLALVGLIAFAVIGQDKDAERERICQPGFAASIRPSVNASEAVKRAMLRGQGIPMSRIGEYELDHIVPLCLDGAPLEFGNLQLQLWPDAHAKDRVERSVCSAYCKGSITLEDARSVFHRDPQ